MTERQQAYIEKNIVLIENNEWDKFFEYAPYGTGGVLYEAGIHFLTEVDHVPYNSFYQCDNIQTITIPDNIYKIETAAFNYCKNLRTVVLSNNLKIIDKFVFHECESLTDIDFPEGLTTIHTLAFSGCVNLAKVHIPASVVYISPYAFADCEHIDIVYDGTKENWSKIINDNTFNKTSYTCTCVDGIVNKSK